MSTKLDNRTLFYYALSDMPISMSLFPVLVFIPRFYAADVGISLVTVGLIAFVVRLSDVVTDPLAGYLSDRTRSRFGRRKPWIAAAAPLLMLAVYMLFFPVPDAGPWYMLTWMFVLSIATTMMIIPYYAWGSELTTDFHERSTVTGWRAMAGVVGSGTAVLAPSIAYLFFGIEGTANSLAIVGTIMLIIMPLVVFLTLWRVPEPTSSSTSYVPLREGLRLMWNNGPFLRLVIAFTISFFGLNITTPLYLFFVADVLGAEAEAPLMLSFFYFSNFLSVPLWVYLSRQIGKHRAYVFAFLLIAVAHPCYMFLGEGDFWYMLPITVLTGIAGGGFSAALPNSMKADVIDLDTLECGENRAALFFSSWSFAQKASGWLAASFALVALGWFGFDPSPGAVNGENELFALRLLFSTIPSIFFLAAAAVIWNYPITEERHQEIRRQLEAARG